jgi:capsular exopolysaccharide synthesis family protein
VPTIDTLQGPPSLEYHRHAQFAHTEAFSQAAEAYRSIRTTLLYAGHLDNVKTVIITSPGPEEGKTTTVSNLGVAIAQAGPKLLLVDADLRKGRLHDIFSVKRAPGLSEYLAGEVSLEQVIQKTDVPNLLLVSCGKVPLYPAELVGTPRMREFIERTAKGHDLTIIDTPPVMAVTDGVVIAALVKRVIAVVQSGKTPRQALERLFKICGSVQSQVIGVILNNVPAWSTPYYYRYSSYRYAPPPSSERSPEINP